MQPERWTKLKQAFAEAGELRGEAQAAFLDRLGAQDAELREEVERLLHEPGDTESVAIFVEPPRHSLAIGESLGGRFRIGRFLGKGGMGEVYEAEDLELGGGVALKVIRRELLEEPQFLGRFRREAQLARQVTHPNVCRIFDVGYDRASDPPRVFLTMELLDGEPLSAVLRRSGRLTGEAALAVARQVAAGLDALHEKGIVHRDIKPANIMIVPSGSGATRAVIGDFGLARAQPSDESVPQFTGTNHAVGTPAYMAPEQLTGKPATAAADIYAFGLVMYELVTGAKPFAGGDGLENAIQRLTEEPVSPRRHVPGLSAQWEAAILRCLARDPANRPARASDAASALAGSAPLPPRAASRRAWVGVAVMMAALLALSLSIWRFPGWPDNAAGKSRRQRVAVLPLTVRGGEADLRVFADGLMETVTMRLSQYEQGEDGPLLVVPASEVRQQRPASAGDAARKLGVNTVVEGSVETRGDRLRLLLALVDTRENRQAASITIEEPRANAWALQDAAVARIAGALRARTRAPVVSESAASTAAAPGAYEFYVVARGYLQRSDKLDSIENAITVTRRALELDPKYAAAHAALAEGYWHKYQLTRDQQWIEDALEHCRTALQLDAELPEGHITMGRIHLGTGRHEEARQDYERALSVDPRSHEAYQGLADAYFQQKLFDKAEATYLKAISMRPGDWGGYRRLGFFYFRQGEFAKAAEQFQRVVDLTPDNPLGYVNLGAMHYRGSEYAKAEAIWLKALKIDPNRYTTLSNLAKLYFETGNFKQSIAYFEKALKLNQRDYLSWGNLGIAYKHERQAAKAGQALAEAIKLVDSELLVNPKRADLYSFAAYYRAMDGNKDIENLLTRAVSLGAEDNDVLIRAAGAYALIADEDRAAELVRRALRRGYPASSLVNDKVLGRVAAQLKISDYPK